VSISIVELPTFGGLYTSEPSLPAEYPLQNFHKSAPRGSSSGYLNASISRSAGMCVYIWWWQRIAGGRSLWFQAISLPLLDDE
jgi:hypothetical protein